MKSPKDFEMELAALINKHSIENDSNTPDFVLARYLCGCLLAWTVNTNKRDDLRSANKSPGIHSTHGQSRIERGELGE